ncbi:MAG TPA: Uma2 family endonuclease [Terracidiphilus sp.]|jgi:Uma2 family endonuclease|nr:Uma2 family endonuclease [Terracidiphilus sp.]
MASATSLITVEEYLKTTADPDCEYVAGVLEERPVGELDHASWQKALVRWFGGKETEWGMRVYPELRIQVASDRFRVPDVTILSRQAPREQIITHPPLAVFEILSPEDSMTRMLEKLADYEHMGIQAIWVIEPKKPSYFRFADGKLMPASIFELPGSALSVPMPEIEKLID